MANVKQKQEEVQGQPQANKVPEQVPHDGKVKVNETRVGTDEVILDPNAPEAVQVPDEGTSVGRPNPLEALAEPSPAEVFGDQRAKKGATKPAEKPSDKS